MKKHKRLEDKILLCKPVKGKQGQYVPYCIYGWHQGFIVDKQRQICERRHCEHYLKLYIVYDRKV